MFEFLWWPLLFLIPLPLIVRWIFPAKAKQHRAALYFPQPVLNSQGATMRATGPRYKLVFASLAWIFLVLACARPLWLGEPIAIPSEGRDLMLAVDLSRSMQQTDMVVNNREADRLTMVKSVMDDFIDRRIGDRLGLILFADTAYLQTPLTYDREIVRQLLRESSIGLVGESTAIGDAIGLAIKRFKQKEKSNRVLILLTDGRNTAGNISVEQALELAKGNQVTVYTIGVGADEQIQNSIFGRRRFNPSADLDERSLVQIAKQTGGEYFRARSVDELSQIYEMLDALEPVSGSEQTLRPRKELFYLPLAIALMLVSVIVVIPAVVSLKSALTRQKPSKLEQGMTND